VRARDARGVNENKRVVFVSGGIQGRVARRAESRVAFGFFPTRNVSVDRVFVTPSPRYRLPLRSNAARSAAMFFAPLSSVLAHDRNVRPRATSISPSSSGSPPYTLS